MLAVSQVVPENITTVSPAKEYTLPVVQSMSKRSKSSNICLGIINKTRPKPLKEYQN